MRKPTNKARLRTAISTTVLLACLPASADVEFRSEKHNAILRLPDAGWIDHTPQDDESLAFDLQSQATKRRIFVRVGLRDEDTLLPAYARGFCKGYTEAFLAGITEQNEAIQAEEIGKRHTIVEDLPALEFLYSYKVDTFEGRVAVRRVVTAEKVYTVLVQYPATDPADTHTTLLDAFGFITPPEALQPMDLRKEARVEFRSENHNAILRLPGTWIDRSPPDHKSTAFQLVSNDSMRWIVVQVRPRDEGTDKPGSVSGYSRGFTVGFLTSLYYQEERVQVERIGGHRSAIEGIPAHEAQFSYEVPHLKGRAAVRSLVTAEKIYLIMVQYPPTDPADTHTTLLDAFDFITPPKPPAPTNREKIAALAAAGERHNRTTVYAILMVLGLAGLGYLVARIAKRGRNR